MEPHDRHDAFVAPKVVRAVAPLHVPDLHRRVAAARRDQSSRAAESQKEKMGVPQRTNGGQRGELRCTMIAGKRGGGYPYVVAVAKTLPPCSLPTPVK